ncbi:hypothetical protein COHA_009901 [Chlorella ohadii]|uniref:Uncharacterized protein n=1 Tax=Chlorella ohadii TaxID=2649997 RepID=A0AAD5DIP3_9CHLO|nr:hypothetical protein COHA_009901 [Chlorella ohadii]KAI7836221.1 hypothetical protein COHA_009901 [Chlorella ohadii]
MGRRGETEEERRARKEAVKQQKAARRLQREGAVQQVDPDFGRKPCDLCSGLKDTLIRCQTDASGQWRMVCGRCWRDLSGGVVDGDAAHPHYRYGGLWRNLHQPAK